MIVYFIEIVLALKGKIYQRSECRLMGSYCLTISCISEQNFSLKLKHNHTAAFQNGTEADNCFTYLHRFPASPIIIYLNMKCLQENMLYTCTRKHDCNNCE